MDTSIQYREPRILTAAEETKNTGRREKSGQSEKRRKTAESDLGRRSAGTKPY